MFDTFDMLVAIFLMVATAFVVWKSAYRVFNVQRTFEDGASRAAVRLANRIRAFDSKMNVLESHASKYFNAMHNAPGGGYAAVLELQQELHKVMEEINLYLSQKNYESAIELIKYLDGDIFKPYPKLMSLTKANLNNLQDWEFNADRLILKICATLETSSEKNSKIYIRQAEHAQGRERKPTLLSVNELRDLIDTAREQR